MAEDFWNSLAALIGGGANLATARLDMSDAQRAAGMADPWAQNRGQYQTMLNEFMADPSNRPDISSSRNALAQLSQLLSNPNQVTSMPGYQYGLGQALSAVNRGAGASGMLNSGNRLMALQDRGEGYSRDWYNQSVQDLMQNIGANVSVDQLGLGAQHQGFGQLARLSGLDVSSPPAAAAAMLAGRQNQQNSIGAGIGGLAGGIGGLANSPIFNSLIRSLTGGGSGLGGSMDLANLFADTPLLDTGGLDSIPMLPGLDPSLFMSDDVFSGISGEVLAAVFG